MPSQFTLSWPTALVLLGVLGLIGLAMYLDQGTVIVVVGIVGSAVTALLPALIQRMEQRDKQKNVEVP